MPADFFIDAEKGMVFSMARGEFSCADALDHMDRLTRHPAFKPGFNQLMDFRLATTSTLTHGDVVMLAERTIFSPQSRRAFVVSADWQFGYSRMFGTLRDGKGETGIMTFRDVKDALAWLSLESEPDPGLFAKRPQGDQA